MAHVDEKAAVDRVAAVSSLTTVPFYLASLIIGMLLISNTSLGTELLTSQTIQRIGAFFITARTSLLLDQFLPTALALVVYCVCFLAAAVDKRGYWKGLKDAFEGRRTLAPNWLVVMPLVTSTLLLLVLAITGLQEALGVPTGSLPAAPFGPLFAGLTTSPVSEEVTFRITTIGLLVVARVALSQNTGKTARLPRLVWLSFLAPDRAKNGAGLDNVEKRGWRAGIHWVEWFMLLVSSIIFGFAHISAGSDWQFGKVTTAALAGFVMGLAFLVYGAYASILLHWFFNYYLQVSSFGAIVYDGSLLGEALSILDVLIYNWGLVLGVIGAVLIVLSIGLRLRKQTIVSPS